MRVELAARPARLVWVTVPPSEDTGDDARVGWFWRNRKRALLYAFVGQSKMVGQGATRRVAASNPGADRPSRTIRTER